MPPWIAWPRGWRYRAAMSGTILSILMLAGIALGVGGIYMIGWRHDAKRGWLMIVAAMVMFMNVTIWTIPVAEPGAAGVANAAE